MSAPQLQELAASTSGGLTLDQLALVGSSRVRQLYIAQMGSGAMLWVVLVPVPLQLSCFLVKHCVENRCHASSFITELNTQF